MNIDLDINNYNYDDLLQLFKIQEKQKDNRQIIQEKLLLIQPKVNPDIYNFYKKSSQILDCIYTLFDSNMLLDLNDQKMISHYIDKIKKIENYEKKNTQNIFQELISLNDEKDFDLGNSNSMNSMFSNLQQNQNIIVDSYSNQVAPGKLNSLKRITQTQNICLNSCFRSQYLQSASTDFDYLIPTEIKNVVSMRLASIEIPNSWYLFSDKKINNTFKIIIDNNSIKTEHIICIPEGNYDIDTIEEFLNTVYFYKSNTDLNFIKFSINPLNYKSSFEIINCDNPLLSFSLTFIEDINQNPMNTCGWIFGFRSPKYININEKVTSEGLFDAGGDRYLYLSLTDYQYNNNNINIIGFDKSILENDILAKVLLVNGKFSLIINENTNSLTKIRKYNGPINLKKIHVKLLDKFGELIDLNQMDFSFTLELELLYESFNFKNVYG
jgi:hypothetical protein